MDKKELKRRGFEGIVKYAWYVFALALIILNIWPGNAISDAPIERRIIGGVLAVISAGIFFTGSESNLFQPNDERNWKMGFGLWAFLVLLFAALSITITVVHGGPLK